MRILKEFCIECRKETEYIVEKRIEKRCVKGKEYHFEFTKAICKECGFDLGLPEYVDINILEFDKQYRLAENIVTIKDIEDLMKIYKLGKAPLSLALGFGEITITRYLMGQIPSKEYSNVLKNALMSPSYMKELLNKNCDNLKKSSFDKAMKEATSLETLFSLPEKLLGVIAYIFDSLDEVTPLALQKLLYYVQGVNLAINGEPMFLESCEAWVHGPVFPRVYSLFKEFKYNPIDDAKFSIIKQKEDILTLNDCRVVDLVTNTFGTYGGKVLERITHSEEPWLKAREGFGDNVPINEIVSLESIKTYFEMINDEFDLSCEEGINNYIYSMLN